MPRVEITGDYGEVKLDGKLLPGIFQGMSVTGEVRIKEEEAQGQSGKYKQALGWEDLSVTFTILLPNDDESTPYDKLQALVQVFRETDKVAKPEVYRIVNRHTAAWGLDKVLVKELKTDDPANADFIRATLTLVEWESPLVKVEARAVQSPAVDRTATLPPGLSDIKIWQQQPSNGSYKDVIEVPDDD